MVVDCVGYTAAHARVHETAPEGLGERLGFEHGTYTETVGPTVDWLVARHQQGLPVADEEYLTPYLDYRRAASWLADMGGFGGT